MLAVPAFASDRPGPPPPQPEAAAPACPDGEIYDLGVCLPRMSEDDTALCREAFERAALQAPKERRASLEAACVTVPLPAVCEELHETGQCMAALCESEDDAVRPGACDLGGATPGMECEFDAIAMIPSIVRALSPDANTQTAELAAMRSAQNAATFDPSRVLQLHAREVDTAISARQAVSTFLAIRFVACADGAD